MVPRVTPAALHHQLLALPMVAEMQALVEQALQKLFDDFCQDLWLGSFDFGVGEIAPDQTPTAQADRFCGAQKQEMSRVGLRVCGAPPSTNPCWPWQDVSVGVECPLEFSGPRIYDRRRAAYDYPRGRCVCCSRFANFACVFQDPLTQ